MSSSDRQDNLKNANHSLSIDASRCTDCNRRLVRGSKYLPCKQCSRYCCISCLGISEDVCSALMKEKSSSISTACKNCSATPSLGDISKVLNEMHQNQTASIANLELKISNMESSILNSVKSTIQCEVDKQVKSSIQPISEKTDRIEAIVDSTRADMSEYMKKSQVDDHVAKLIQEMRTEDKERERRKPNLIIYQIPEQEGPDELTKNNKDLTDVRSTFEVAIGEEARTVGIKLVKRLGIRSANNDTPRPILVSMVIVDKKFHILKNSYKLANHQTLSSRRIVPDRTVKERNDYKKLRAELVAKNDPNLVIRQGKIVRKTPNPNSVQAQNVEISTSLQNAAVGAEFHPGQNRISNSTMNEAAGLSRQVDTVHEFSPDPSGIHGTEIDGQAAGFMDRLQKQNFIDDQIQMSDVPDFSLNLGTRGGHRPGLRESIAHLFDRTDTFLHPIGVDSNANRS